MISISSLKFGDKQVFHEKKNLHECFSNLHMVKQLKDWLLQTAQVVLEKHASKANNPIFFDRVTDEVILFKPRLLTSSALFVVVDDISVREFKVGLVGTSFNDLIFDFIIKKIFFHEHITDFMVLDIE